MKKQASSPETFFDKKSLFQLFADKATRESVIVDLKFARQVILNCVDDTKTSIPNHLAYSGFLILKLSDMQKNTGDAPYTHAQIHELGIDFQNRAAKALKADKNHYIKLSETRSAVAQEVLDLKYAAKLIYGWATKNERISPNDALYIGFMLHAKYRLLTGETVNSLATPESLTRLATEFHELAVAYRQNKLKS